MQERTSLSLFQCILGYNANSSSGIWLIIFKFFKKFNIYENKEDFKISCPYKNQDIVNEINRRLCMTLYITLLALVACYLLSSRKENKKTHLMKYFYFFVGFVILIFAEISVRYSGKFLYITMAYYLAPTLIGLINYLLLFKVFKHENLK